MRKHLYLITEHERDESVVGTVEFAEQRIETAEKNVETPMRVFDKETGDFSTVGRRVALGYVDFDTDELDAEQASAAAQRKLKEVDERHLTKAGVELEGIGDE